MRIGITGHRVPSFAGDARVCRGIDRALDAIVHATGSAFRDKTNFTIYSPLAEGADCLVARRALDGLPRMAPDAVIALHVALPLPHDDYLGDFGTPEAKRELEELLARAEAVETLPSRRSNHEAYEASGRWILERSDVLIAVWDGKANETGKVVTAARRRGTAIAWVHAANRKSGDDEEPDLGHEQGLVTFEGFPPPRPRLVLHVGVTGHRAKELAAHDTTAIADTVGQILDRLRACVERVRRDQDDRFDGRAPILRMFSRLADGADLLAAEVALAHGWEVHCPLPFARGDYEESIDSAWRARYRRVLENPATRVLELDGATIAAREAEVSETFFESRRMVLRHSDVLVAIWNPDELSPGLWGTSRLVAEAKNDDLIVAHIEPQKPHTYHVDERGEDAAIHTGVPERLVQQVERLLALGAGQVDAYEAFLRERDRHWTLGFVWRALQESLVDGWPGRLRLHVRGAREGCRGRASKLWQHDAHVGLKERPEVIDGTLMAPYTWADVLADHYANLTRSSFVLNYFLAAAAVATALAALGLGWTDEHHPRHDWAIAWTAIEMLCIVLIVANTYVANAQRWHERWMNYRMLAERLRLQRPLALLGRVTPYTHRPAHLSFGDVRGTWVGWYFRAFARELGMLPGKYEESYVVATRACVVWLLTDQKEGQIPWHTRNADGCHTIEHRLHRIGTALFVLTAAACAAHFVVHSPALTFVAATFPALGAALSAIAMHLQLYRISQHSKAMAQRLDGLCDYLERARTKSAAIALPCEEIAGCMTTEVLDWRSLFRGTIVLPA